MPPQTTPKDIKIEGITIEQALAVIQHHIATDLRAKPQTLAQLQRLRSDLTETPDRPMSSSESPGMKAARDNTRPEFQHSSRTSQPRQGHATKQEQPSPGQAAAGRATTAQE